MEPATTEFTLRHLIELISSHSHWLPYGYGAPVVLSLLLNMSLKLTQANRAPWTYIYSLLVYLVCLPGIFSITLVAYALFFTNENLLDANILVYFLPIVTMVLTLVIINKKISMNDLPGFERLSALMLLMGVTFLIILAIRKTHIGIFFWAGGLGTLFILGIMLYLILQWSMKKLFQTKKDPNRKLKSFLRK